MSGRRLLSCVGPAGGCARRQTAPAPGPQRVHGSPRALGSHHGPGALRGGERRGQPALRPGAFWECSPPERCSSLHRRSTPCFLEESQEAAKHGLGGALIPWPNGLTTHSSSLLSGAAERPASQSATHLSCCRCCQEVCRILAHLESARTEEDQPPLRQPSHLPASPTPTPLLGVPRERGYFKEESRSQRKASRTGEQGLAASEVG